MSLTPPIPRKVGVKADCKICGHSIFRHGVGGGKCVSCQFGCEKYIFPE